MLARQYELAKIDEARDATLIQILDKAVVPERKSKPKRTVIVLMTGFVTGILAVLAAFILQAWRRAERDPSSSGRLGEFLRYLRWRR